MTSPLPLAVSGALGRMGAVVCTLVESDPRVALVARLDRSPGEGLSSLDDALGRARVVIDVSTPAASVALAKAAGRRSSPPALVIGSTGFDAVQETALVEASERVALLRSGNFSLGVNLLAALVRRAAAALDPAEFDIEIFEAHHRRKVDAPSGTARLLGEAAAAGRGVVLEAAAERVREGVPGPRAPGAIGFCVMRGGGIVGEHQVVFAAEDEILTLSHSARDRSLFARGALAAALWIAEQPPGLYDMQDVLGLKA